MTGVKVGYIGVGNIGGPMALRMLDKGIDLTVCDRRHEALAPFVERGAGVAGSPKELADVCEIILSSMPSIDASQQVALGEQGVIHGSAVKVHVETSTIGSVVSQKITAGLRERGIGFVDAPVSGGPEGARAGTLAIMASGLEEDYERVRPVLETLAASLFYFGPKPGTSQLAKLLNNHISAAGRLAVLEALAMGIKAGLDPKILNDVFMAGSARNSTTEKVPRAILSGRFRSNGPAHAGPEGRGAAAGRGRALPGAAVAGPAHPGGLPRSRGGGLPA
ncbi:NAD(P)-dependent oxidoreductase [Polaromonas sp. P1(28)-13]|nr:NAD(P)-dependent oxidoreductase [Polaromonas sp. P1(28)-13]